MHSKALMVAETYYLNKSRISINKDCRFFRAQLSHGYAKFQERNLSTFFTLKIHSRMRNPTAQHLSLLKISQTEKKVIRASMSAEATPICWADIIF